jgi:hypothetical protein
MSRNTGPSPSPKLRFSSYTGLVLLVASIYLMVLSEQLWVRLLAALLFLAGISVLLSLLISLRRASLASPHPWRRWVWLLPIGIVGLTALFFVGLLLDLPAVSTVAFVGLAVLPIAFPIAARMAERRDGR